MRLLPLRLIHCDTSSRKGIMSGAKTADRQPISAAFLTNRHGVTCFRRLKDVLDHFGVDDVTLMGFSLGGCLVMRAAAFEPRVSRVIADDILTNFTECFAYRLAAPQKALIGNAGRLPAAVVVALINQARSRSMFADWGIGNAEWVFGVDTPAKALAAVRAMRTDDVSPRITQDVLLMAGAEDHYVPLGQLGAQIQTLTNARSVTARIFTRAPDARAIADELTARHAASKSKPGSPPATIAAADTLPPGAPSMHTMCSTATPLALIRSTYCSSQISTKGPALASTSASCPAVKVLYSENEVAPRCWAPTSSG